MGMGERWDIVSRQQRHRHTYTNHETRSMSISVQE